MRIFINYLHFTREEAQKLIRNDSNNDHWPTVNTYIDQLKDWLKEVDKQQGVVKDYLQYLTTIKVGQESFVIRIVNDINTKLKALNAKDKKDQYYLDRVKQRPAGTIGVDLSDPILKEIKSLREGLDFPEYQAVKEQLKVWNDNPNSTIQRVREIFASYQMGQWDTIYAHFREWNNNRDYPIKEVNDILDDWRENNHKVDSEFPQIEQIKSLQIQLKERRDNSITFIWRLPLEKTKDQNDKDILNRVFPNITNYLFYLNGEYYEVNPDQWTQTDWETAEIVAEKSMFYNGYWWLIKSPASGWVHHSPVNPKEEICNCMPTDYFTSRNDFTCDYELKFALWRIGKKEAQKKEVDDSKNEFSEATGQVGDSVAGLEMVMSGLPTRVWNISDEQGKVNGWWAWTKSWVTGVEGILYLLLNEKLKSSFKSWIHAEKGQHPRPQWKRIGNYNSTTKINDLTNETQKDLLDKFGLTSGKMYHCLSQHIKATIFWREKPIWEGNYFPLHNDFRIIESASPSGSVVNIWASGLILAQITELITSKIGGDNQTNSFLSGLISVGTTVAAAFVPGGAALKGATMAAKVGATAGKAAIGAVGSMAGTALNHSLSYSRTETNESMSIHEFKHRYLLGGRRPLKMRLEWSQESFNSYLNKRTFSFFSNWS